MNPLNENISYLCNVLLCLSHGEALLTHSQLILSHKNTQYKNTVSKKHFFYDKAIKKCAILSLYVFFNSHLA